MITGAHMIHFSADAEADRAFFRDTLALEAADAGGGWLIFALPPAELAVHPSDGGPRQELFLICEDLDATMEELRAKGVEFVGAIGEERWGRRSALRLPSGGQLALYEPHHMRPSGH